MRIRRGLVVAAGAALALALLAPGAALAKGPGSGGGGGGGGGGGETSLSNNLSVPAVFVSGGVPTGLVCDGTTLVNPETSTTAPLPYDVNKDTVLEYYYVQGVHKWQAHCITADTATATAEWGDNLTGDASLKVGSPIRVEVGLIATSADGASLPSMTGWNVLKLQPDLLDRESKYGTLAEGSSVGAASYPQDLTASTRVKDSAATLTITGTTVQDQPITPEINATGKVVYGYNLRVTATGVYEITFEFPNVTIQSADAGTPGEHTVTLTITVGGGGGGGGGGGNRPW